MTPEHLRHLYLDPVLLWSRHGQFPLSKGASVRAFGFALLAVPKVKISLTSRDISDFLTSLFALSPYIVLCI